VLCLVALVAGFLGLRKSPGSASMAIRVGSAGSTPVAADDSLPQTPAGDGGSTAAAEAISLPALVAEIRARTTTSTTLVRSTTTTVKKATTTTTAVPRTTTSTTTPAPAITPPTTPAIAPLAPVTTLLAALVPPAVAVTGAVTRTDSGVASWFRAPAGTCAHRTLPMGTMIKVTRNETGASATCKVDDRGPTVATVRLIDLSLDTFEKLASRDAGLIDVRIEW
jgi:rare lipoprotein A